MEFRDIIQFVHSWLRWGLVVVVVVAAMYFLLGMIQSRPWDKRAQTLLSVFSSLIGLQWIVGLVLFLIYQVPSGFGIRHQWEHLVVQTVVLAVAHIHYAWRRREMADSTRWRNGLLLLVGVTILAVVGIGVLPAVTQWRFYLSG